MLTPKQEKFCIDYLRTGNATEAYRLSYEAKKMKPETINRTAKELIDNPKIAARIEELRAPVIAEARITLASHLEELKRLRDDAAQEGQFSAAINAEVSRGKASGLYVARHEVTGADGGALKVEDISDEELEKKLRELGLVSVQSQLDSKIVKN